MMLRRFVFLFVFSFAVSATSLSAAELIPFRGHWEGSTESATPVADGVILVVSSGTGNATHLGAFAMTSPHLTYLATFAVEGTQIFTAANGDTVTATITGQFIPTPEGNLQATLDGIITGGTGRFAGATGSYDFHIIARPAAFGFDSTATIEGVISSPGAN